jgi:hypothetical protein
VAKRAASGFRLKHFALCRPFARQRTSHFPTSARHLIPRHPRSSAAAQASQPRSPRPALEDRRLPPRPRLAIQPTANGRGRVAESDTGTQASTRVAHPAGSPGRSHREKANAGRSSARCLMRRKEVNSPARDVRALTRVCRRHPSAPLLSGAPTWAGRSPTGSTTTTSSRSVAIGVASQGDDDALGAVGTSGDEAPLWGLRLSVLSDAQRELCHYVCVLSEHADEP